MLGFVRRRRVNDAVNKIMGKRPILTRYVFLFLACLIIAFAFNIFFLKNDIVCFGVSGLSIVLNQFGVKPSLFILITNMILLIIAYFVLGKDFALKSMVGSILFPICVSITEIFIPIINFDNVEKIILAIMGAVLSGIGYGLVYKSGYTTGGTDIINQIISKYTHITVGKAMRITDGLIVLSSKLVFSWETILYGYVVLYIITTLSDKILFGRSKCKTFYIVTEHYDEVKEYILSIFNGVTLIDARSGYDNEKKKLLLVVIPTNQYYFVKDVLKEIDKDIFFMVSDAYEIGMKGDLNEG